MEPVDPSESAAKVAESAAEATPVSAPAAPEIAVSPTPQPQTRHSGSAFQDADSAALMEGAPGVVPHGEIEWQHELSSHRIAIELRHIEAEVRKLIEERDPKRKRKLAGTHRWHELEEDIISWRYSNRFDEPVLQRLRELIARRHYLFRHLKFVASTRPTWNT